MKESDYTIRPALPSDRSRLANLIHFGSYIHQHLDWKAPLDWIGSKPYLLIEKEGELLSVLACPPDLPDITWIRLFACSNLIGVEEAWKLLWEVTSEELLENGKINVAAISLQSWFNELLNNNKFEHTDNVIVLIYEKMTPIPDIVPINMNIRPMMQDDLEEVEKIDHAAFGVVWKNSLEALELAYQQSILTSVAEIENEIVGYQFSTSSSMGGHLARLAVTPTHQGKGIGNVLVHEVLSYFKMKGYSHVTVNTQQNNAASLALYYKAGFTLTGESYRVYQHNF